MTIEQNLGKRVTLMVVKKVEFGVYLGTDDDMSEKLSVIRIIIGRECRKFLCLSDIMEHRCCQKKIAVDQRILFAEIVAHLHDT